jgi:putative MFS transporter
MGQQSSSVADSLVARLERLPMTPYLWMLVLVAGGAWFVESLSIGATGVILPVLKPLWHLSPGQVGFLAVSSTVGVVVGLIPAGRVGDRIGRVRLLTYGIWVYSGLTLLSSLAPNYGTLVALRLLAGLGMGAVFPLPYAIVSEFVSRHRRTWLSGVLDACLSVGYFIAPLLGLLILPRVAPDLSWRLFLVAAGLPLLYALVVSRVMPESPRWLWHMGRRHEALTTLDRIEERSQRYGPLPPPDASVGTDRPDAVRATARQTIRRYLGPTVVSMVGATGTFFMFYVVMTYMPTVFNQLGLSFAASLAFAALVTAAAIPGKLLNGHLSERWGRKVVFALFMGMAAVAAVLFATAPSIGWRIADGMGMSFFGTGAFPGLKMYYAEQYPTGYRVTGASSVEAVSRTLGGIVGAAMVPLAWHSVGLAPTFMIIAAMALVSVAVVALFGRETRGLTLERIAERYLAEVPAPPSAAAGS